LGKKSAWHKVGPVKGINEGTTRLKCEDRELFIHRKADAIRVYDSHCPHQVTNIPELGLTKNILTCPKHKWKFDITTGECIENGDRPLKQYENRMTKGVLEVYW